MRLSLLISFLYLFAGGLFADEPLRPSQLSQFHAGIKQKHYKVIGAQVAWVDFALVRHDFPEIRHLSDSKIEQWILDNFAYISEEQLRLRGIRSSHFEVDTTNSRSFFHPPDYRRASVAEATNSNSLIGLIDLKGSGHSAPSMVSDQVRKFEEVRNSASELNTLRIGDHNDGLMSLGEGFAEISRQRAIQAGYEVKAIPGESVETYFAIDLGFDILKKDGDKIPAGIIGRQAHIRGSQHAAPPELYTDDHGGFQRSITRSSVDMGGVKITIPEIKDNFVFSGTGSNPQLSRAWSEGHRVAASFREASKRNILHARHLVYEHFSQMLGPLEKAWLKIRPIKLNPTELSRAKNLLPIVFYDSDRARDLAVDTLKTLKSLHDPAMTAEIVKVIESNPSRYTRLMRLVREGNISDPSVSNALRGILFNPGHDGDFATSILQYLIETNRLTDTPEMAIKLVPVLLDNTDSLRDKAVDALKSLKSLHDPSVTAEIVKAIESNPSRYTRLMRLIREGNISDPSVSNALRGILINPNHDGDFATDIFRYLVETNRLSDTPEMAKKLVPLLLDSSDSLRDMAVTALKSLNSLHDPTVTDEIVTLIKSNTSRYTRLMRLVREGHISDPSVVNALRGILFNPRHDGDFAGSILQYLIETNRLSDTPEIAKTLVPLLLDKTDSLRDKAVDALKSLTSLHDPSVTAEIVTTIESNPSRYTRLMRLVREGNIRSDSVDQALHKMSKDSNTDKNFAKDISQYFSEVALQAPNHSCAGKLIQKTLNGP